MQITAGKLTHVLQQLDLVVPRKTTLQILKYALLRQGSAIATSLDLALSVRLPECANETLVVPVADVLAYLQNVPHYEVCRVEAHGGPLEISSAGIRATFTTEKPDDFPPYPEVQQGDGADPLMAAAVDGDAFLAAMTSVSLAAATDDSRPVLATVCVTLGDQVEFAATDGFRLSILRTNIKAVPPEGMEPRILVPRWVPPVLGMLWRKSAKPTSIDPAAGLAQLAVAKRLVRLTVQQQGCWMQFGDVELRTTLVAGEFPNYMQLVPHDFSAKLTIDAESLAAALRQAQRLAGNGIVRLSWEPDKLTLRMQTEEVGTYEGELAAQLEGQPGYIAFSIRYLQEYLARKTGLVTLQVSTPSAPGLWSHPNAPVHVMMPMFVSWDGNAAADPAAGHESAELDEVAAPQGEAPAVEQVEASPKAANRSPFGVRNGPTPGTAH